MLGEHHDLIHELPEHKEAIHYLKMHNAHFLRLFDEYHTVTHTIESIEKNNSNITDAHLKAMKIKRLDLEDGMLKMIRDNKS